MRPRHAGGRGGAGRLAQLVEHLLYTERVGGSSPSAPTSQEIARIADVAAAILIPHGGKPARRDAVDKDDVSRKSHVALRAPSHELQSKHPVAAVVRNIHLRLELRVAVMPVPVFARWLLPLIKFVEFEAENPGAGNLLALGKGDAIQKESAVPFPCESLQAFCAANFVRAGRNLLSLAAKKSRRSQNYRDVPRTCEQPAGSRPQLGAGKYYRLLISRLATAIHGGAATTIWRRPAPSGRTWSFASSRPIRRPNRKRPEGRGISTSRFIAWP